MSDKLIKYTRKECLGVVGVDSGTLMVMLYEYRSRADRQCSPLLFLGT